MLTEALGPNISSRLNLKSLGLLGAAGSGEESRFHSSSLDAAPGAGQGGGCNEWWSLDAAPGAGQGGGCNEWWSLS